MTIETTAADFFAACETGQGWAGCAEFCHADAGFDAQSEPLVEITTLEGYCDWMKGLFGAVPDGSYEVTAFGVDEGRNRVVVSAIFSGTHSGAGGPQPPTGKSAAADYAYVMSFEDGKIRHMTKIWNAPWTLKALGWV